MTTPFTEYDPPSVGDEQLATPRRGPGSVGRGVVAVFAVGTLITGALVWTSWSLNNHNEGRLLDLQAKQVQSVLTAAIPATQIPLELGAEVAASSDGNVGKFRTFMETQVGRQGGFSSATLWQDTVDSVSEMTSVGAPSGQVVPGSTDAFVRRAFASSTFVVTELSAKGRLYLGYAFALPGTSTRFAVYAERPIPAARKARVASNSAFSDLGYAIYLGPHARPANLLTTDFNHFPVTGRTHIVTVPFGDTVLTVVVKANTPLGGGLSAVLPWIVAVLGLCVTAGAAWLTARLIRRRQNAEVAEVEVREANDKLEQLYGQQRTIADTLQRALLPQSLPEVSGMEVAARYLPGARGVEIGGDWYSFLALSEGRFLFVVGDVSGRGLAAASIMARLRFTIRAHALDGDAPSEILDKCARQLDVATDGHFATVLIGIGDIKRGELTLASAGHLAPLLLTPCGAEFIEMPGNRPIGVNGESCKSVTISITPPATLLAFTDGLVERRDEIIDFGLKRLEEAALSHQREPLDSVLGCVLDELAAGCSEDDIAILGLRWTD